MNNSGIETANDMDEYRDSIVKYRVPLVIRELVKRYAIIYHDDFSMRYSIRDDGEHRLYEFHMEVCISVKDEEFLQDFSKRMSVYNDLSDVRIEIVSMEDYPTGDRYWDSAYLTVTVV